MPNQTPSPTAIRRFALLLTLGFMAAVCGITLAHRWQRLKTAPRGGPANLELSFEPNLGQADPAVRFLARGAGYSALLTANEVVFRMKPEGARSTSQVRMRLEAANPAPVVSALEPQRGESNYLIGNDASKWRTGIPHYAKVKYQGVYRGIDMIFYGNRGRLEYDFVVAAGADPRQIRMSFDGPEGVAIDPAGHLRLRTREGALEQYQPVVWQETRKGRQLVATRYLETGKNQIGFEVASYDHRKPLVIDPRIVYSSFLGGSGADAAAALDSRQPGNPIAVDSLGNVYLAGETASVDFPTVAPLQDGGGGTDAFVAKVDPSGSSLIYSTYFGGDMDDRANGIALDSAGNICLTGRTDSSNFPLANPMLLILSGLKDAWIAKLSADGRSLLYSTYFGGNGNDAGFGIAVDSTDKLYVAGGSDSDDLPTTPGAYQEVYAGMTDAFVTKIDPSRPGLSALVYSTFLGGAEIDRANGIAVDSNANAYVTGRTASSDFPTLNGFQSAYAGGLADCFVTVLNSTGASLRYSSFLGGTASDLCNGIALDALGRAHLAGETSSANFPTRGAYQTSFGGGSNPDAMFAVIDPSQVGPTSLIYSTFLGGSGIDRGTAIAVDQMTQNAYVTGETRSSLTFPVTADAFQLMFGGGVSDGFVAKFDPTQTGGASLIYSSFLGGAALDIGSGITVDSRGSAWVTGQTSSANFPVSDGAFQTVNRGGFDAFVTKISDGTGPGCTATKKAR